MNAQGNLLDEVVPLPEAFRVLRSLSDQALILGLDAWRHPVGHDSLSNIDPLLATITSKQPPTKFGRVQSPSLWTAVHFYLALPALSFALKKYGHDDEKTRQIMIKDTDLPKLFVTFPHILAHFREYQELRSIAGDPTKPWWDEVLTKAFEGVATGRSASSLLDELPGYLQPKAQSVLSGAADSLSGRIALAYLLAQGIQKSALPFDQHTESFLAPQAQLEGRTLYERLVTAQQSLQELTPYLTDYDPVKGLRLDKLLGVVSWYARPHLVEMMIPGLVGAEAQTIRSLSMLFTKIINDGGPDYTAPQVSELPTVDRFRTTQSISQIGRLSLVKDLLSADESFGNSEGMRLRHLMRHLFTREELNEAWGNATYYIPDHNRNFELFRQDIANVIFCAGLYEEHATVASRSDPAALKRLAQDIVAAENFDKMRLLIGEAREVVNNLEIEWQVRYPNKERTRILHFVCQTFGLEQLSPIPIPLVELNKGFAGSIFDGRKYQIAYVEAGEKLTMTVPLAKQLQPARAIIYRTMLEVTQAF
jgi:hypothetical protein